MWPLHAARAPSRQGSPGGRASQGCKREGCRQREAALALTAQPRRAQRLVHCQERSGAHPAWKRGARDVSAGGRGVKEVMANFSASQSVVHPFIQEAGDLHGEAGARWASRRGCSGAWPPVHRVSAAFTLSVSYQGIIQVPSVPLAPGRRGGLRWDQGGLESLGISR